MNGPAPERDGGRCGVAAWFANAYVQLAVGALLVTASELLLKKGASSAPVAGWPAAVLGVEALRSGWTWLGIVLYVLATISWLHVLRLLPLAIAFGLVNVVHVLVPLGAWAFLHESISPRRWIGIALILAGIVALSRPAARAEEALSTLAISLCVLCQLFLVAGQVLLKHAMAPATAEAGLHAVRLKPLALGIASLSAWFFLWVGLLQQWELSQLFPFEGLNPALLVLAAWLFLGERVPLSACVGIALITVGVVLVSGS